jgi:stage IV sporulation protein B
VSGRSEESEKGLNAETIRRLLGMVLLGFIISLGFLPSVQQYVSIPKDLTLFEGQHQALFSHTFAGVKDNSDSRDVISVSKGNRVNGQTSGETAVTLAVNNFPVKKVDVKVLPDFRVIPGGQSIGVKLNTVGVLVVGHHLLDTAKGEKSPGELAGIQIGDIITKINGKKIEEMSDVAPLVKEAGQNNEALDVTVLREKKTLQKTLKPLKGKDGGKFRIGLYIRDSAAGIGTLTFYHPESMKYGALGHVISDMDTKQPIKVHDGKIVRSEVTTIEKGDNGKPGEKIAKFPSERDALGTITENSPFGVFGKLSSKPEKGLREKGMPITLSEQVKEGPAKIYTVIEGNKVEAFDVEIISSVPQKFPATKGLVIKITDPELLKATGGIVQGMSGSPIIQDDKVVGAVTHVFVNDPTSGYGVHIEWMLDEAGIDIYQDNKERERAAS